MSLYLAQDTPSEKSFGPSVQGGSSAIGGSWCGIGPGKRSQGLSEQMREVNSKRPLSDEKLQDIVRRIVEVARPERIILFGSAARGEMGPNSDLDLLVVKRGQFDERHLTGDIYLNLHGADEAVDVIVVTPEQVERYRNTHCLVIAPALREGREVYRA